MIVYRDIVTGDEMLSDAFPLKPVTDSDGTVVSINRNSKTHKINLNLEFKIH